MRRLGSSGPLVSAVGLGCGPMSGGSPDDSAGVATIRAAVDSGITFIDTADFYGNGHNEGLVRQALRAGDRERVVISDKVGGLRDPAGRFVGIEGRPAYVKALWVSVCRGSEPITSTCTGPLMAMLDSER